MYYYYILTICPNSTISKWPAFASLYLLNLPIDTPWTRQPVRDNHLSSWLWIVLFNEMLHTTQTCSKCVWNILLRYHFCNSLETTSIVFPNVNSPYALPLTFKTSSNLVEHDSNERTILFCNTQYARNTYKDATSNIL